jgi:uncharacterized protein YceH (UPF0502 family)
MIALKSLEARVEGLEERVLELQRLLDEVLDSLEEDSQEED